MRTTILAGLLGAAALAAPRTEAQVFDTKSLTIEGAKQVAAAAVSEARRLNAPGGAIAVVDEGGNLLYLERLDNTFPAASDVSIGKARTAALFRRPTKVLEDAIVSGRTTLLAAAPTPLQGGVPITVGDRVVGAIGVSGAASANQDTEIAVAGAAAKLDGTGMTMDTPVTYLGNDQVTAAFAKGAPLLEVDGYKIHASRREAPGQAEVHELDTDVIYVLKGTATFVTGGSVEDGKTTGPQEIRGAAIKGGETRTLRPGDVMVVPAGTPHWFKQVQGPFLYYVVKVTERGGM